jgi:hypothetical protein
MKVGNVQTEVNPRLQKPLHSETRASSTSGLRKNYAVCMTAFSFYLLSARIVYLFSGRIYWHKDLLKPCQHKEKIISAS